MTCCKVQEPARRHRVRANGVDGVPLHAVKVPLHLLPLGILFANAVSGERAIGDAVDKKLLIAYPQELSANCGSRGDVARDQLRQQRRLWISHGPRAAIWF